MLRRMIRPEDVYPDVVLQDWLHALGVCDSDGSDLPITDVNADSDTTTDDDENNSDDDAAAAINGTFCDMHSMLI